MSGWLISPCLNQFSGYFLHSMDYLLDPAEVRVLGSLIEKQIATPDYYPLTFNSLLTACNQKTARNPVTDYDEKDIMTDLQFGWALVTNQSEGAVWWKGNPTKLNFEVQVVKTEID